MVSVTVGRTDALQRPEGLAATLQESDESAMELGVGGALDTLGWADRALVDTNFRPAFWASVTASELSRLPIAR